MSLWATSCWKVTEILSRPHQPLPQGRFGRFVRKAEVSFPFCVLFRRKGSAMAIGPALPFYSEAHLHPWRKMYAAVAGAELAFLRRAPFHTQTRTG